MPEDVVVVGVGMMTAVGLSAPETAASVRTATMRFAETSIRDHRFEPFTLAEVLEEGLPELREDVATTGLSSREIRLLRLAASPLNECLSSLKPGMPPPGLVLALPETATTRPLEPALILRLLERQSEAGFDVSLSEAGYSGRAGGLMAIQRAARLVATGQTPFMVAGGVDTYRDLYVLSTLDMEKRVRSSAHLDGFIPGEGAAFLLLATRATAGRAGLTALAALSTVSEGFEQGHLYSEVVYRGDGLAVTVQQLIQSGGVGAPIRTVYSSMNGENYWAKEWGVGFIRNSSAFDPEFEMHQPADCFGDIGAACGPLLAGLAALGISGGYRGTPSLVYCSSDFGKRAAMIVSTG